MHRHRRPARWKWHGLASAGRAAFAVAWLALVALSQGPAAAACGDFYRVKNGDTLQFIAARQMGNDDFAAIFRANVDILRDPSLIEVGQLLYLPCPDGPATRRDALAAAGISPTSRDDLGDRLAEVKGPPPDDAEKPPLPDDGKAATDAARAAGGTVVTILTAGDMTPLVDRSLPSDGMALVIVEEALRAAGEERPIRPSFVDDRNSHLPVLMPTGAFPLALPWPRPDCRAQDLSAATRRLCGEFLFTEAFYEIPVSLVVPAGSPLALARSTSALSEHTICRPAGFPPVDLEAMAIPILVVGAPNAADCARLVAEGKADAISLPDAWTGRLLSLPAFAGTLEKARYMGTSVPIHAVAWRGDPGAAELVDRFDTGLRTIQDSGRWVEVIQAYLRRINRLPLSQ